MPHRLRTLDSSALQLVMAFASPETEGATAERRKWAATLLLARVGMQEGCVWVRRNGRVGKGTSSQGAWCVRVQGMLVSIPLKKEGLQPGENA